MRPKQRSTQLISVFFAFLMVHTVSIAGQAASAEQAALPDALLARAEALRDRALAANSAFDLVSSLTMEVGPRLAGSEGDRAAVAWALTKFRELGFDNVETQPVEVPHWERGSVDVRITEPFPQRLVAAALGGSVGTSSNGMKAPVIGFDSLDDLKNAPDSMVAGSMVYIGDRMARARDGVGYGAAVKKRGEGAHVAAQKGARALLIRSAGTSAQRLAHTGSARFKDRNPVIPAVALSNPDADMLEAQLASGHPVSVQLIMSTRSLPTRGSANVIAEVPGNGETDEVVLLAAHLDSWDLGTGAIDDGAGVAIVMAVAELIKNLPRAPRRSVRVLLAANEEFGLSGAKAYAAAEERNLKVHVVGLEADLGAGRVFELGSRVDDGDRELVAAMHSVVAPLGIAPGDNEAGGGADLSPMRKLGMPVLAPRQDASKYFDYHHNADDTMDKVDRDDLNQNVAVYAALTLLAADMPGRFQTREAEPETTPATDAEGPLEKPLEKQN